MAHSKEPCACGGPKDYSAKACRKCAVWAKALLGRTGAAHPAWKGGQRVDEDGYIKTYAPDHPFPRRGGYVFEHVRLMELHLGRRLEKNETVHHKDHDRQHNELSNFELKERGEHSRHHRALDAHTYRRDARGRYIGGEVPHAS